MNKDNLSWTWRGQLNYNSPFAENHRFFLKEEFTSNLFRQSARENNWKDENTLESGWRYHLSQRWDAVTRLKSHIFSDENSFVKFSKHLLMEELAYTYEKKVRVAPAIGWAAEDIYSFRDQGWYTQIDVDVNNTDLGGYLGSGDGFSAVYWFPNRKNQEHRYFLSFEKEFSEYARDSIRVGYEFVKNAYYISPADTGDNLENVEINARYLYNRLNYRLSGRSRLNVETTIKNRDILQENPALRNRRDEFNLNNNVEVQYQGQKVQGRLAFINNQVTNLTSRRTGGGAAARNDLDGLQAAFNMMLNWKASRSDEFRTSFSYTKYEYASPDTAKKIDEDDLRFISDLQYSHRFSAYFSLRIKAHLYLYHQIYIHSSRSGNNNWNRIYQLTPSFNYRLPGLLEHTAQIKILANYTVYDFEEVLPQARSYIYRKMVYSDSLRLHLTRSLDLLT
ncbi:MAG: hypothetical protein WAN36_06325, partial [Calditrichia bacterium]